MRASLRACVRALALPGSPRNRERSECPAESAAWGGGLAEEGAVAEPRRLTTTQSSVRDERGAACDLWDLLIKTPATAHRPSAFQAVAKSGDPS